MNRQLPSNPYRWRARAVNLAAVLLLALLLATGGGAPPAQASLYWAAANGEVLVPPTDGIQSSTPSVCFVGNAVDVRLERVTQIIQYIHRFELAGNVRFKSPAGNGLADELTSGNVQNLKCPAPIVLRGGTYRYAGDIRVVLPGTDVDATTPVPGVGCVNDELFSDPDCASWDASHISCAMRGYDDAVWVKTYHGDENPPGWHDFATIGGVVTAGPSLASRAANQLDAVARGSDNGLWFNHYDGSTWSGWSGVSGTAGNILGDPDCTAVTATLLQCSVRWTDNSIRLVNYTSGVWSLGTNLGVPAGQTFASGPSVASWSSSNLSVVARASDGALWMRLLTGSNWGSWFSLGGVFTSDPDCVSWGNSRLDCFGRGLNNQTWHRSWNGSTWSSWEDLDSGSSAAGGPGVTSRATGGLDVFVASANGDLRFSNYTSPNWYNWVNLGQNSGWGSWSNAPWVRNNAESRACQYNLKLGDDPWCPVGGQYWPCASNPEVVPYMDHTLHEFGHAMGLAHEHARNDTDPTCTASGYGDGVSAGKLTPYDRSSVMNYQFLSCGINGNYGNAGLSYYDQLGLHMLYPPDGLPAEFVGATTLQTGQTLSLNSAWISWGAYASFVSTNYVWKVDGVTRSTASSLSLPGLTAGAHSASFEFDDFLERHHATYFTVRVLSAADYNEQAAVLAVQNAALNQTIYFVDVPQVSR